MDKEEERIMKLFVEASSTGSTIPDPFSISSDDEHGSDGDYNPCNDEVSSDSNTSVKGNFKRTCLMFYIETIKQIVQRFDVSDPLYGIIELIEPSVAQKFEVKDLSNVLKRFPNFKEDVNEVDLQKEWKKHAFLDHNDLGFFLMKEGRALNSLNMATTVTQGPDSNTPNCVETEVDQSDDELIPLSQMRNRNNRGGFPLISNNIEQHDLNECSAVDVTMIENFKDVINTFGDEHSLDFLRLKNIKNGIPLPKPKLTNRC
ncbi:unnamed protein product [Colias eurytheme]|nr:unnamed protein product [Colias eurytheme]